MLIWIWAAASVLGAIFALILGRDVMVMTTLLRALRHHPESLPRETKLIIPGMRQLGHEALLLIRAEKLSRARAIESAATDRALVEKLPDALIRLDAAGQVDWRNASADAAFGMEVSALLRHPALRAALLESAKSGEPVRKKVILSAPVLRDLDATVIPVGGPVYILVSDRTRERSIEKMRADFVANSSHELRTPLASLIGFIETLQGPAADDPEAQKRFLGIMAEQAARMQRVIGDLLSLSRIEISEHQPPEEIMHVPPLLERIVASMEPMLAGNGTRIEMNIAPGLPAVPADADQLAQVFTNLLDNAIKYGKRGGLIKVIAVKAGGDARFEPHGIVVSVADDGAGIPRDHIPRLTERFYRVDKGRSRAVGGTGLGLAIVKHVVNRHRGRLVIDSTEGKGTIFTIWLPARRGAAALEARVI
jgi:two-component system phosphate regulon sensor histidine kinase PhoR